VGPCYPFVVMYGANRQVRVTSVAAKVTTTPLDPAFPVLALGAILFATSGSSPDAAGHGSGAWGPPDVGPLPVGRVIVSPEARPSVDAALRDGVEVLARLAAGSGSQSARALAASLFTRLFDCAWVQRAVMMESTSSAGRWVGVGPCRLQWGGPVGYCLGSFCEELVVWPAGCSSDLYRLYCLHDPSQPRCFLFAATESAGKASGEEAATANDGVSAGLTACRLLCHFNAANQQAKSLCCAPPPSHEGAAPSSGGASTSGTWRHLTTRVTGALH
jgi:hypothetical protein